MPAHVEDYRRLSADMLRRAVWPDGRPGQERAVTLTWSDGWSVELAMSAQDILVLDGSQTLIETRWTPCPFGGSRMLLLCPCCGRSTVHVYLVPGRLPRCRRCLGVRYRSQDVAEHDRCIMQAHKLAGRLDDGAWKPKGMHWATFDGIRGRMHAYDMQALVSQKRLWRSIAGDLGLPLQE